MKHLEWALKLALVVAERSKDPSTKVGAVIFDDRGGIVGAGFNGLPMGVDDTEERLNDRPTKYKMVRHAEANALAFAGSATRGAALVVTHPCCTQCAGDIIQHGVKSVIYPAPSEEMLTRWGEDFRLSAQMFSEAGVEVIEV